MAQKLAGSLALVTCKEPLKSNLATHLRQLLGEHGFNEVSISRCWKSPVLIGTVFQQMVPDQVVQLLVQDNLDIACTAIEKAAKERAVSDVDEGFGPSYDARRRHREVGPCQNDCIID
jgi:CCR4-NOT transcription complex subunit 1